jgi:hypothetical protein
MNRKITRTTDGKYIGLVFDDTKSFIIMDGVMFTPQKIQDVGGGLVQYSNVHYVILTKEIK